MQSMRLQAKEFARFEKAFRKTSQKLKYTRFHYILAKCTTSKCNEGFSTNKLIYLAIYLIEVSQPETYNTDCSSSITL